LGKSKYSKKEIKATESLLRTYFEANLENPDDRLHEILLEYCKKECIYMEQLPVLKKLSLANKKIAELEKPKSTLDGGGSSHALEATNQTAMETQ
jgi:hypothetical protein